jgi:uncharacterized protein (TIGR02145 family)
MKLVLTSIFFIASITLQAQTVTIGTQVWMTKNLDVDKFRNGDVIPEAKSEGEWKAYIDANEAAWCYYNNDPANGEKYGKLYNWYAVADARGLCPTGWHVPSDDEWNILTDYLGGEENAGDKMKSKTGWNEDGNGTNSSGFSGLPGGLRTYRGSFNDFGLNGHWWSSTEDTTEDARSRDLNYYCLGSVDRLYTNKETGFSVRCLRD